MRFYCCSLCCCVCVLSGFGFSVKVTNWERWLAPGKKCLMVFERGRGLGKLKSVKIFSIWRSLSDSYSCVGAFCPGITRVLAKILLNICYDFCVLSCLLYLYRLDVTLAVGNANYIHVYYVDIEIDFDVNVDIDIDEILLEFCANWSRFQAEVFELNSESLCPLRLLQCFCV